MRQRGLVEHVLVLGLAGLLVILAEAAPAAAAIEHRPRTRTLALADLDDAFVALADDLAPSVVAISVVGDPAVKIAGLDGKRLSGAMLDRLLKRRARVVGTGFCIDADGYILTNQHVVHDAISPDGDAGRLFVTTDDGTVLPAIVLGSDPRSDLAVLKVPAKLPAVTFAGEAAERGQWCLTIGNPLGVAAVGDMSLSVGVVSATGRSLPRLARDEDRRYHDLIQVTAEVNPGNSGGPLFDLDGHVTGIVTAVVLPQEETFGMGFAVPATGPLVARVERLKAGLPPRDATLGVLAVDARDGGVVVREATRDNGLINGDVIRSLDGRPLDDAAELAVRLAELAPDADVRLGVERDGEDVTVDVPLAEAGPHRSAAVARADRRLSWQGVTFAPVPEHWRRAGIGGGVVVASVEPDSPHAGRLRAGEVVTRVGTLACADLPSLQQAIFEQDDPAILLSALLP